MRHPGSALLLVLLCSGGVPSVRAADGPSDDESRPTTLAEDGDDTPSPPPGDEGEGEVFRHFTAYDRTMTCEADEQ